MSTVHAVERATVEELESGAIWRVRLNAPKTNILDLAMIRDLTAIVERAGEDQRVKVLVLSGAGPHFSYGASIEEHLPERIGEVLPAFHGLFRKLCAVHAVLLAAVRGQCLGGGLELAAFCHRVLASPEAKLGQPEIRLGVFAPVASLVLPERMGRPRAEELCLTGRVLTAEEALRAGLVDQLADDPGEAAVQWARGHVLAHSAASLRYAAAAVRLAFHGRFLAELDRLERLYLDELMRTHDAVEGIQAFLAKRAPQWRNA